MRDRSFPGNDSEARFSIALHVILQTLSAHSSRVILENSIFSPTPGQSGGSPGQKCAIPFQTIGVESCTRVGNRLSGSRKSDPSSTTWQLSRQTNWASRLSHHTPKVSGWTITRSIPLAGFQSKTALWIKEGFFSSTSFRFEMFIPLILGLRCRILRALLQKADITGSNRIGITKMRIPPDKR
jgi:hypothetical protein